MALNENHAGGCLGNREILSLGLLCIRAMETWSELYHKDKLVLVSRVGPRGAPKPSKAPSAMAIAIAGM